MNLFQYLDETDSPADGIETRPGDVFELESELFGRPLIDGNN